jgi:hypothetical protein
MRGLRLAVAAAPLIREVRIGAGMAAIIKTSGAMGVHGYAPLESAAGLCPGPAIGRSRGRRRPGQTGPDDRD